VSKLFNRLLIANRGEIAVRVARACRELGIGVVAVYSTADRDSAVVRMADEAVHIGPPPAQDSYLNVPNIIEAALQTGAQAIHPGYGFLSEDPDFAEICAKEGLVFVGPRPEVMARLGDKTRARALMAAAGLPLLPGTVDPVATAHEGQRIAADIGYPVIIKAAAGGGGRGVTVVRDPADFAAAFHATRQTARAVFGDPAVYLERFLTSARHVEVQVLADEHGNAVHLGERDCSVQRRHQKLLEEAPSSRLDERQRAALGELAVRGALAVGYTGAGTLEFLLDTDGRCYLMEMNARIQVEHPVTEMVTGIDLVQEQIRIAAGQRLRVAQHQISVTGAAVECRINAEDPDRDFAPTPGRLVEFELPAGPWTRVDSGYRQGATVPPNYDSLLAKLIVWAPTRTAALARMRRALAELRVSGPGIATTAAFHQAVLGDPSFRAGTHDLNLVDRINHRKSNPDRRIAMAEGPFDLNTLMDILVHKAGLPAADRTDDPAATLADIGLDSLAFLQLQTELQDGHGIELADDRPQQTFGELLGQIHAALAAVPQ
jgi:acetyl-CoA carboxylase biotin carboxylase subunit